MNVPSNLWILLIPAAASHRIWRREPSEAISGTGRSINHVTRKWRQFVLFSRPERVAEQRPMIREEVGIVRFDSAPNPMRSDAARWRTYLLTPSLLYQIGLRGPSMVLRPLWLLMETIKRGRRVSWRNLPRSMGRLTGRDKSFEFDKKQQTMRLKDSPLSNAKSLWR